MSSAKILRVTYSERATRTASAPTSASTWIHAPVLEFPLPDLQQGTDNAQEANNSGTASPDIPTVKHSAFSFETRIPTGTKGNDGTGGDSDPAACFMQKPLESFFGVAARNTYKGGTVGSTSGPGKATDLVVNSTTNCAVGDAIMINGEIRFIEKVVDATHLTLNADLASSPALNDVIYAAFNFSPTLGEYAKYLDINGERDGHAWLAEQGKMIGLMIQLAAKGLLKYQWKFDGNDWTTGVTPDTFTESTFTGSPVVASAGQVIADATAICISEAGVDFGVKHEDQLCATGVNGSDGLEIVEMLGAKITAKKFYAAGDWTVFQSRAGFQVQLSFTVGSTNAAKARGGIAVWVPNAQMNVKESTLQSQVGEDVEFLARNPAKSPDAVIAANVTKSIYYAVFGGV